MEPAAVAPGAQEDEDHHVQQQHARKRPQSTSRPLSR
jgi:hypothetical protein